MSPITIDWKSSCDPGIEDMDFQHRYFVKLINRLSNELNDLKSFDQVAPLINELDAYARFHFISEENMMRRNGYPDVDEHKKLHFQLIDQLGAKQGMLESKLTEQAADEFIKFLINWFLEHTAYEDKLFAEYLKNKKT